MNKKILSCLAISLAALQSTDSDAQSSVTLYGLADNGIDFVNNSAGKQLLAMRDGTSTGIYGSRWGLIGHEDLGGGLETIFRLESGFNLPSGTAAQGGREFGRQAYIGLASSRLGTVTFGRQYDSVVDFMQFASTTSELGTFAAHGTDVDNLVNSFRIDNAVKYTSPTVSGFRLGVLMNFSGTNAANSPHTIPIWSVGADYSVAGAHVAASYLYANRPAQVFTTGDGHFIANTTGAAIGASGPWSYIGNPDHMSIIAAGGTYNFGNITLGGIYTRSLFAQANGTSSDVSFDNYDVSVRYQLNPAWRFIGGYLFTVGHIEYLGQTLKYHRFILGSRYALSKRTEVYGLVSFQQAAGDAHYADLYQGALASMSTTNRQIGGRIGIVHRF
ncbi:porin [Paraburkholderia phymatum]|uniref:Porin Gram-negative type n=1 Tax=Paraburkholderia phymatum (strain DSM 17167 / CIP 108236 / LMG 21445 / STM815) TaxID=391038 RepID=B2JSF7_PARP8|nr:porin [Paraburkholderia phymatum]ACC73977.1 porin Gram-negative type [Paraburkholderia phymatum STM815]